MANTTPPRSLPLAGLIDYDEFARLAMLPNPKGGTAIYPKPITTNARDHAERMQLETRTIDESEQRENEEMHKTFHEQLRPDPDSYVDLKVRFVRLRSASHRLATR